MTSTQKEVSWAPWAPPKKTLYESARENSRRLDQDFDRIAAQFAGASLTKHTVDAVRASAQAALDTAGKYGPILFWGQITYTLELEVYVYSRDDQVFCDVRRRRSKISALDSGGTDD